MKRLTITLGASNRFKPVERSVDELSVVDLNDLVPWRAEIGEDVFESADESEICDLGIDLFADLASHGLIEARIEGRNSVYRLTKEGAVSLAKSKEYFERAFGDILQESRAGAAAG